MLEFVKLIAALPMDYWFCDGVLFIKKGLPQDQILEIIKNHLQEPCKEYTARVV